MLLMIAICAIAVMDKEWNFVKPGLWLEPTPVEQPRTTRNAKPSTPKTTHSTALKAKPASRKATPAKQKVTYPIDVPY